MLRVENLKVHFKTELGIVKAVDRVSFDLREGEKFTLIGESGSGKSVLAQAILRLLPENAIVAGKIIFKNRNILELSEREMRKLRGKEIAWIPQSQNSLNPVLSVGFQCAEPLIEHFKVSKRRAFSRVFKIFKFLGIESKKAKNYPHQFSGGMKQRVLVAMGLSAEPELLIADEPTKGLDANKIGQIIKIFKKINKTMLIITHDLRFADKLSDRVAVMYCGEVVEISPAKDFFSSPLHPYSKGLLDSLPSRGLKPIKGFQPSMIDSPKGCKFRERCEHSIEACKKTPPVITLNDRLVRCWLYAKRREIEKNV